MFTKGGDKLWHIEKEAIVAIKPPETDGGRTNHRGDRREGIRAIPVVDLSRTKEGPETGHTMFGPEFSAASFFAGTGEKGTRNPKRRNGGQNHGGGKERF